MQNPFSFIGEIFSSVLRSGGGSVIGVDIGSAYLKVVQLRRRSGKAVLETYGELALGPYGGFEIGRATHLPSPKLSEALRDLLREAHVTTASAGVAIPFSSSLVTIIEMPSFDQKELAVVVPIEARKYIPVPISEVSFDWWIIPDAPSRTPDQAFLEESSRAEKKERPQKISVLIAAIHNEAMSRFETVIKDAEVKPDFFEIEIFSAIRALFPQDLLPHAVLDMGAAETKLYIIDQGLLRFSHIINHGAQELTLSLAKSLNISVEEAERQKRKDGILSKENQTSATIRGLLDYAFSEANQAIQNYKRRFGGEITDILLSGGGANLPGIEQFATEACDVPVKRANPFSQVEAPAFLDEVLQSVGPEFSVALGAAFRKLQETG